MARVQPVLSDAETALVDRVARATQTKRSDVIRQALGVYHWFLKHTLTGARIVARKPTGEEVALETPELSVLEAEAHTLSPQEVSALAKRLAATKDAAEAARLREQLARGFYGI
jgi:hypothetical protein